jgi:hypothetical protein
VKKLNDMTKEQKQISVLVGLVAVISIYATVTFGIAPLKEKWGSSRVELEELSEKLGRADRTIDREPDIRVELSRFVEDLSQAAEHFIPDPDNTLAWVTRRVYQLGRDLGMDIEAVVPSTSGPQLAAVDRVTGKTDRFFDYYGVRISTSGTYLEVIEFVKALETSNPYLAIAGLSVSAISRSPEEHAVQIDVHWPIWASDEGTSQIRTAESDNHG